MSKKYLCILLAIIVLAISIVGCTKGAEETVGTTADSTATTEETTTEPTIPRTTEDLGTTFPETATNVIYKGLTKDKSGSYPYLIASYSTSYHTYDKTRTANLKAAVEKINNIKIPAGGVFSFNQTVGKRTVTAGYESAKVINNGEFVDGLGGGVCQVSSTVFECVLRANVEIVKRTYHTLTISYVPLGGDATVQWNTKDFQFKNTLGCDTRLKMTCDGGTLKCELYAKDKVDVGDVKINITKSGNTYTLTRTVDGVKNYSTQSTYKTPKPSTTKPKTTKKESTTKQVTTKQETTKKETD